MRKAPKLTFPQAFMTGNYYDAACDYPCAKIELGNRYRAESSESRRDERSFCPRQRPLLGNEISPTRLAAGPHFRSWLPKLFLRLLTKSQTSDFPMTLAKSFFAKSLVDSKGLEFYHRY